MAKNQYKKEPLKNNVEEMFIGPFGSSLKNECFVDEEDAYCMVYEQKHAIQKTLDGKNRFVDKNKYYELKRFTIKPGDIIVSCRGTIGETFIVPENAPLGIMHPSIMKIRLKPNVYNIEYFNLLLKNRLKDYNKSANGSGIKMAISATELGKELFPIPPMDEQQKTSKIFLMVNHLILLRKQQLAKLDELVKARFVEMFGDPVKNTMDWEIKPLSELGELNRGVSKARPRNSPELLGGPYPLIQTGEVANAKTYITSFNSTYSEKGLAQSKMWPKGTLCITIAANIAQTSILTFDACFPDSVVGFISRNMTNELFIHYWFSFFQKILDEQAPQVAQKNINLKILSELNVIVPPLSLQNRFAAFVERVDQQKQTIQQSLEKLELMKKALMQEYFG